MGIIRFAINNPVKVTVGVILLMLFGLLSVFHIPIQLIPNVDEPRITVSTFWEGASPQEIEREIVERRDLTGVLRSCGVKYVALCECRVRFASSTFQAFAPHCVSSIDCQIG